MREGLEGEPGGLECGDFDVDDDVTDSPESSEFLGIPVGFLLVGLDLSECSSSDLDLDLDLTSRESRDSPRDVGLRGERSRAGCDDVICGGRGVTSLGSAVRRR